MNENTNETTIQTNWKANLREQTPLEQITLYHDLEKHEKVQMIKLLSKDDLAEVFSLMEKDDQEEVLQLLSQEEAIAMYTQLDSDDLVDTLQEQELPANVVVNILRHIPSERRNAINTLLHYPEESVGSLMSIDFIMAKEHDTKERILAKVEQASGSFEHNSTIYITDQARKLIGYIHLVDLLRWPKQDITDAVEHGIVKIQTVEDQEEASLLFQQNRLLSIPVVDTEDRMVGILTADDIFEVMTDEIHEDYLTIQGVSTDEESLDQTYLKRSVLSLTKDRIFWLLFLMISATFTGLIISRYEEQLVANVALTAFIPMLMDSSGNAGNQASTLITRALSLKELKLSDTLKIVWKEARVGLLIGLALAAANFIRIMLIDDAGAAVALTVSLTLAVAIIMSKIVGSLLPMFATAIKQDPAVMAGPMVTTIVDAIALITYFNVANFLLR